MTACAHPLDPDRVAAWLLGELDDAGEQALEQHLFGCASCASMAEGIQAMTAGLAELVPPVVTANALRRLRERGLRVGENVFSPGDDREAFFAADLDLLVHRLVTDPATGPASDESVDVEIFGETAEPLMHVEAVPLDRATGAVYVACQRHYRAMGFPNDLRFRVSAVRGAARRVLGEYDVRHRWPP